MKPYLDTELISSKVLFLNNSYRSVEAIVIKIRVYACHLS